MSKRFFEHPAYIGCINVYERPKRLEKYEAQFNKDGFDDTCTWSLDYSIARFILPRLKRYYELADEVIVIDEHEGFREAIEEMIEGFQIAVDEELNFNESEQKKVNKAFEQLAKYHNHLWW